jgi:hypothetical protein
MSSEATTPALSEEQAREAINRWADAGFFRLRNMGDKIFIDQITPGAAYTLRLQTHLEQRKVRQGSEPYLGGSVDDRGRAPDPADVPVKRPGPFQERTQTLRVPHTERVQACGGCSGQGRVSCSSCLGQGRVTCPACGGAGFVEQQVVEPGQQDQAAPTARTVRRNCTCSGGQVTCSACAGNRLVVCSACAGSGQVKTFQQLVVRFHNTTHREVLDVTPVPDNWLGTLSGQVLFDRTDERIDECDSVPETVARKAKELLDRSHAVEQGHERILQQYLHVERIPLQEVRYKYAGVERQLWICGSRDDVYAPKAPWNRGRLFSLLAGVALAVAATIVLIVYLVS